MSWGSHTRPLHICHLSVPNTVYEISFGAQNPAIMSPFLQNIQIQAQFGHLWPRSDPFLSTSTHIPPSSIPITLMPPRTQQKPCWLLSLVFAFR